MQVNGGAPAFLDKNHYSVYISQPISLIRLYIEWFMIYVKYSEIHTFKYTHFCTYTQFDISMTKTMHSFLCPPLSYLRVLHIRNGQQKSEDGDGSYYHGNNKRS